MVMLTQWLLQYVVLVPCLASLRRLPSLSPLAFFLLMLWTICAAAAGYIINDIEDYEIDVINKPQKNGGRKRHFKGDFMAFILGGSHFWLFNIYFLWIFDRRFFSNFHLFDLHFFIICLLEMVEKTILNWQHLDWFFLRIYGVYHFVV
jgi:hypothetical protein